MAIIKCKECNADISDKALACPKCGLELIKGKFRGASKSILVIGVILVALFLLMDTMFSTSKAEQANFESSLERSRKAVENLEKFTR